MVDPTIDLSFLAKIINNIDMAKYIGVHFLGE